MSAGRQMARSSALYFAGRGLSGVVTMLLLPLYTTHIDTAAYGYYETASSVVIVLVPVLCLEAWTGMLKYTLARRAGACRYGEREIYGAAFLLLAFGSAVFALGCTAVYLFYPFRCFGWVLASGISLALCCTEGCAARCEQKNAAYAVSGVIGAIASAIVGIVSVYALKMQAQALFAAFVAGNVAQILWLESQNRLFLGRKFTFRGVDGALLRALVRFCVPLGLNAAVFYLMNNFNKVIINAVLGESAVGIFSVVGKFMAVAATVAVAIEYAWAELTFSLGERADKAQLYNGAMKLVTSLSFFLVLGMLPAIRLAFPYLVGEAYAASFWLIPVYYYSLGFSTVSRFLVLILHAENDTKTGLWSKGGACVLSIGALLLLLPRIGLQAAGVAASLGAVSEYLLLCAALRRRGVRAYPAQLTLFTVCYALASAVFYKGSAWGSLFVLAAAGVAFLLVNRRLFWGLWQKLRERV